MLTVIVGLAGAFVFGSAEKVDRIATYHELPATEVSALFGHRGLFRA